MKKEWTIGTRGSKLALRQTEIVAGLLKQHHPDCAFQVRTIKTKGDTVWDQPLHEIGGKGLFVKEIEEQLIDGRIDLAVHSVKDLPAELEENLTLGAILEREDPRDAFISLRFDSLQDMQAGARIGTGSLRRKTQLLHYNNTLDVVPLRGNIDTRLRKLTTEGLDGIILAGAGVRRMGLLDHVKQVIPFDIMIPSCGQGAIGVEIRANDGTLDLVSPLNHKKTFDEVSVERTLLHMIGGGCHLPLGIHADITDDTLALYISMGNQAGELFIHEHFISQLSDTSQLVSRIYEILKPNLV